MVTQTQTRLGAHLIFTIITYLTHFAGCERLQAVFSLVSLVYQVINMEIIKKVLKQCYVLEMSYMRQLLVGKLFTCSMAYVMNTTVPFMHSAACCRLV